jgi:glutamate racemase
VQTTRARRIGVLATEATVASGRYREAVLELDAGVDVFEVACPGLADRIQRIDPWDEELVEAVRRCCAPLLEARVDTVILGCTHYPLVRPLIQREMGREVALVTAAEELAGEVAETLRRKRLARTDARRGSYRFACTGDVLEFAELGRRFLQFPLGHVQRLALAELALTPV